MIKNQVDDYGEVLLDIKKFYNHIVDETVELMNLYGCKTPLEIYCLFNLINSFYVKEDYEFQSSYMKNTVFSECIERDGLRGIQVVLNGGVCRHRTAMLNDIYMKMGIDSIALHGQLETLLNFYYGNSNSKQIADRMYVADMLKKISEGAKLEDFKSHLKKRKISYNIREVHDDYFATSKKRTNHVIVMVGSDKRYYLDPMNDITYYKDDKDIITLRNNMGLYFFADIRINRFFWRSWLGESKEKENLYNKILELPGAIEKETDYSIKEIYSYLKKYKEGIKEFIKSNEESIEVVRRKILALPPNSEVKYWVHF